MLQEDSLDRIHPAASRRAGVGGAGEDLGDRLSEEGCVCVMDILPVYTTSMTMARERSLWGKRAERVHGEGASRPAGLGRQREHKGGSLKFGKARF